MTDIDKERLKSFLNDLACEAPSELQEGHDTLIHQLYVYAFGKKFWKGPVPLSTPGEIFYAGPFLLTKEEEKRAACYLRYRDDGHTHEDALKAAADELNKSDKLIEAAQTKFRKRQADIDAFKKNKSRK